MRAGKHDTWLTDMPPRCSISTLTPCAFKSEGTQGKALPALGVAHFAQESALLARVSRLNESAQVMGKR
jgi:hypothetical protein